MRVAAADPRERGRRSGVEGPVEVRAAGGALRAREGGHGRARVHDHLGCFFGAFTSRWGERRIFLKATTLPLFAAYVLENRINPVDIKNVA